jgi:transcriptional regulator with XRE-family HTH domain
MQSASNPVREVRKRLGEIRKRDISLEQLADELGCTLKTVWRCEQEKRLPKSKAVKKNFLRLAKLAGVDIADTAANSAAGFGKFAGLGVSSAMVEADRREEIAREEARQLIE